MMMKDTESQYKQKEQIHVILIRLTYINKNYQNGFLNVLVNYTFMYLFVIQFFLKA